MAEKSKIDIVNVDQKVNNILTFFALGGLDPVVRTIKPFGSRVRNLNVIELCFPVSHGGRICVYEKIMHVNWILIALGYMFFQTSHQLVLMFLIRNCGRDTEELTKRLNSHILCILTGCGLSFFRAF